MFYLLIFWFSLWRCFEAICLYSGYIMELLKALSVANLGLLKIFVVDLENSSNFVFPLVVSHFIDWIIWFFLWLFFVDFPVVWYLLVSNWGEFDLLSWLGFEGILYDLKREKLLIYLYFELKRPILRLFILDGWLFFSIGMSINLHLFEESFQSRVSNLYFAIYF